jgi:hypothetical protein
VGGWWLRAPGKGKLADKGGGNTKSTSAKKKNSTRPNGPNRSSLTCSDRLTEFQPDGVVTASHPPPSRIALLIAGLSFSPCLSSSLRLGCKPICIIQTGCRRGLLRSAPRSLCMNSWTYGNPLSIASACQLQSLTFDIRFALSLPVPPYNAPPPPPGHPSPPPMPMDHGPRRTTNDGASRPYPATPETDEIGCGSRHALETAPTSGGLQNTAPR